MMPGTDSKYNASEGKKVQKIYKPVQYSEFLLSKVGSNFDSGKGKYDS